MKLRHAFAFLAMTVGAFGLSACGTSHTERGITGGAIGAGIGAGAAAVTGGSVGTGAIVGGAAGAITGILTDPDDINLD